MAFIFALSVFGRGIQDFARSTGRLGLVVWIILGGALLGALGWLVRREGPRAAIHVVWLAPLALLLPSLYPLPEERVHFALFGAMGFFTLQALPRVSGVALALSIAGLDEMLQWFVPDRVADWRDVGVNALSALVGGLLALRVRSGP